MRFHALYFYALGFDALNFHIFLCELLKTDNACSEVQLYPEGFHYETNQ